MTNQHKGEGNKPIPSTHHKGTIRTQIDQLYPDRIIDLITSYDPLSIVGYDNYLNERSSHELLYRR